MQLFKIRHLTIELLVGYNSVKFDVFKPQSDLIFLAMNKTILIIIFIFAVNCLKFDNSFAQAVNSKKALDLKSFNEWCWISDPHISSDGAFLSYIINNSPITNKTLFIKSLKDDWVFSKINGDGINFTQDCRYALFKAEKDSLYMLDLKEKKVEIIKDVNHYELLSDGTSEWLILKSGSNLAIKKLYSEDQTKIDNVINYKISKSNTSVVIYRSPVNNQENSTLELITLGNMKRVVIDSAKNINEYILDKNGELIAYIKSTRDDAANKKTIWLFRKKNFVPINIEIDKLFTEDTLLSSYKLAYFSNDGSKLFFNLVNKVEEVGNNHDSVSVNVWSYSDPKLQSLLSAEKTADQFDLRFPGENRVYIAAVNLKNLTSFRLEYKNEKLRKYLNNTNNNDIGVISQTNGGDVLEINWNPKSREEFFLTSFESGKRTKLEINYPEVLSPGNKFLVGTDSKLQGVTNALLCYEIKTCITRNLTKTISIPQDECESPLWATLRHKGFKVAAWLPGDTAVLIYDKYDIWQIDPKCERPPINVTNGYGRKMKIILRIAREQEFYGKSLSPSSPILLSALDINSKKEGFFELILANKRILKKLSLDPYHYLRSILTATKTKEANIETSIVQRESSNHSRNYFLTKDFKNFERITNVSPETNYNWITSELHSFKTNNGSIIQGVLYKPENYQAEKKYPTIIHFYESYSENLNKYLLPESMGNNINIPYFVSNGYIVFVPDMHYKIGHPGEGALNCVLAALKYLKQFTWIDSTKIGIQAHSWGGFQVNYIITKTKSFAAAMSSSGASNFISEYGSILDQGNSKQFFFELDQYRIGGTLWETRDAYIENSPVLFANQISTPLLMMNNKLDGAVSFSQGIEFFTALRRLGKKVWMLQYEGEGHSLSQERAKIDYTIRTMQFFDYFLKGMARPNWLSINSDKKRN